MSRNFQVWALHAPLCNTCRLAQLSLVCCKVLQMKLRICTFLPPANKNHFGLSDHSSIPYHETYNGNAPEKDFQVNPVADFLLNHVEVVHGTFVPRPGVPGAFKASHSTTQPTLASEISGLTYQVIPASLIHIRAVSGKVPVVHREHKEHMAHWSCNSEVTFQNCAAS